jgi:hypothetical protein
MMLSAGRKWESHNHPDQRPYKVPTLHAKVADGQAQR